MLLFWVNSVLKSLVSAFTPVRNLGEGIGGIGLSSPSLFLDQTEAQKAEKNFLGTARRLLPPPTPLSQDLDDRSPLSEGLDGHCTTGGDFMQSWH